MSKTLRLVSRLAWLVPAFLLFLTVNQGRVALELRSTLQAGTAATAEVLDLEVSNRVDVTYDYVSLRIPLPGGGEMIQEKMALPHSLAPRLEGKEEVAVLVQRGAAQEVVITEIAETQWRIAAVNAAMSLIGALLFGGAIFAWNRYLDRQGDPGHRQEAAPETA